MSKLIMWNMVSLDGCFEGAKSWEIDWFQSVFGGELEAFSIEQLRSAGTLLFGRVTYQGMAAYWQTAEGEDARLMNSLPKAVASRTLQSVEWNNTRLIHGDVVREVATLKSQSEQNIFVFGSAHLSATLMEHGLFDEYRLAVVPAVLRNGKPLFKPSQTRLKLNLLEARPLSSGCVILRYEPRGV
jgi:dihydrofolate reductase